MLPLSIRADLVTLYSEPGRYYHTLEHIQHCLRELESVKNRLTRHELEILTWALWFHDAVYDTNARNNKAQSALLLLTVAPEQIAGEAEVLILNTAHNNAMTLDKAGEYMVDIDLAILGQSPERYLKYSTRIRDEYSWVPMDMYAAERTKILQGFLCREHIYNTEHFRGLYEKQARINIEDELQAYRNSFAELRTPYR